uniref:Uncharacterized protein n=1 Tax=Rhizophora mucronata TaxID=61149 RepID=A0A2P2QKC3_RHIMU
MINCITSTLPLQSHRENQEL